MSSSVGKVFSFDMDGVIADTVASLYRCYLDFLSDHGVQGTKAEFGHLNGPSITEIVHSLKTVHHLSPAEEDLEADYRARIDRIYEVVQPVDKVRHLIAQLRLKNVPLALASSSPRVIIERVLQRFQLTESFDRIISGDDVGQAKPSPEIYHAVQQAFPGQKVYVIEDSPLGVSAAHAAGLDVIAFDPSGSEQPATLYRCRSMDEVLQASEEILSSAEVVSTFDRIELRFEEEGLLLSPSQHARVQEIWDESKRANPGLFAGPAIVCRSHSQDGEVLEVNCLVADYKVVLAHLRGENLGIDISPLGVSGIVVDPIGRTLLGRRKDVTEYRGWYELVPSGTFEGQRIESQIREEFAEETGLSPAVIASVEPFCLILDERHQVYDVGCRIQLARRVDATEMKGKSEYEDLQWVGLSEMKPFFASASCVPTSRALWQAFEERDREGSGS